MAGAASTIGAFAAASVLAMGIGAVGAASVHATRAAGAADAAALAAADTATGVVAGIPCERASQVAAAVGAVVVDCGVTDTTATVQVRLGSGLLVAEARARAGPPPVGP